MNHDMGFVRQRLGELQDLCYTLNLLEWDMEVLMPSKGAAGRGRCISTVSALHHRLQTEPRYEEALQRLADDGSLFGDDALIVREAQYDCRRAACLPEDFVIEQTEAHTHGFNVWRDARDRNDFAAFRPCLEKNVELARRAAEYYGYDESPYDALLENFERGMTAGRLRTMFGPLAESLKELVVQVEGTETPEFPDGHWPVESQQVFERRVMQDMGYDFEAGRVDIAPHPFCTMFDLQDVRITTRYDESAPLSSLYTVMHESGHALYDAGFDSAQARTPLATAPSLGIHECNSRMWENLVGRSRAFWHHYLPVLQETFPRRLDHFSVDDVFRLVNRVQPSLIRVDADECTYNLHVVIRFELELAMIEGTLSVSDLPDAWKTKYREYLGIDVPDDRDGCMQDVHWASGLLGYFPTYTLGNIYAAEVYAKFRDETPGWDDDLRHGRLTTLLEWLRPRIHRVGRRKQAAEIVQNIIGREPAADALLMHLRARHLPA